MPSDRPATTGSKTMTTNTARVVALYTDADFIETVDKLGALKAQIADLKKQEDELKLILTASGYSKLEGKLYSASVSGGNPTSKIDWEAIATKLEPSRQLITAHTHEGTSALSVRVYARSTK
jgi:hypothetical protein